MRPVGVHGVTSGEESYKPTDQLWRLCPAESLNTGRRRGWYMFDDFHTGPSFADGEQTGRWNAHVDAGGVIKSVVDATAQEASGVLQMYSDGDGENVSIITGGESGAMVKLDLNHRAWFEARWKVATIADTKLGAILGFHEPVTQSTSVPLDGGAINDKDYLAFFHDEDDGDQVNIWWNKESGTDVVMETDAKTLVADTYVKTGFLWDPTNRQDRFLEVFIDGVLETQSGYTTVGSKANTISDTTNFPGGQSMAVIIAVEMAAAGSASVCLEVDWIAAACQPIT